MERSPLIGTSIHANLGHTRRRPFSNSLASHKQKCYQSRQKRTAEYFGWSQYKEIPEEFRLFTDAQIGAGGAIPFFTAQTKANARWLQITQWEMLKMMNDTEDGLNAIKEEMRATRLMDMVCVGLNDGIRDMCKSRYSVLHIRSNE